MAKGDDVLICMGGIFTQHFDSTIIKHHEHLD